MTFSKESTEELQLMRERYVPRGVSNSNLNIASSASSATITDIEGNEWIDFAGAIGVLNVGHTHPKVTKAVKDQVDKFLHPGFNVILYEVYLKLAKKLCDITPGSFNKKAVLFNSGAEAVENAVKLARRYTNRQAVVSFQHGFHGRTNLTMGMTSKVKPYKVGFGPFAPEVYQAPYPYMYHKPENISEKEYVELKINEFKDFFISTVIPEEVACVVMEPIQGEGGFIIPPKKFVKFVQKFCKQHGILFIADEIQTGFGRTGKLFAVEHFDVTPELITLSKSLAAGLPLSAVIGREEILNCPGVGELGGTFSGSPVACAAALTVIDIVEEENLLEKSEDIGHKLESKLNVLKKKHEFIGDVRRLGAMVAVELVTDRSSKEPNPHKTAEIVKYANENGLLLLSAGIKGNVIRFLIPLVITDEELSKGFEILDKSFEFSN